MFGTLLWRRVTPYSTTIALLCLASACGRIGVEILPFDDDPLNGVDGRGEDGGGNGLDGGNLDASWGGDPDADIGDMDGALGPDGAVMPDTGPDPIALCMMSCQNDHGGASCASGSCVTTCANGYGDCDRNVTNGCEADIMASAVSCGMCGLSCVNPNGTTRCSEGLCAPSCASGFADCDEDTENGCETSLNAVTSCGGCTNPCTNAHGSTLCQAGSCVPTCSTGW
ncbi:MAG TPA: hypothetical protein VMF89_08995, partial [Polyangiales bacterium]|nr:hypothetical protein [Polyangiales bacterium]